MTRYYFEENNLIDKCCIYDTISTTTSGTNIYRDKNYVVLFEDNNNLPKEEYNLCNLSKYHDCNKISHCIIYIAFASHIICGVLNKNKKIITVVDPNLGYTLGKDAQKERYDRLLKILNNKLYFYDNSIIVSNNVINNYILYDTVEYLTKYKLTAFQSLTNSGSCQTWSMYIALLIILNKGYTLRELIYHHQINKNLEAIVLPKFICYLKYLATKYKLDDDLNVFEYTKQIPFQNLNPITNKKIIIDRYYKLLNNFKENKNILCSYINNPNDKNISQFNKNETALNSFVNDVDTKKVSCENVNYIYGIIVYIYKYIYETTILISEIAQYYQEIKKIIISKNMEESMRDNITSYMYKYLRSAISEAKTLLISFYSSVSISAFKFMKLNLPQCSKYPDKTPIKEELDVYCDMYNDIANRHMDFKIENDDLLYLGNLIVNM